MVRRLLYSLLYIQSLLLLSSLQFYVYRAEKRF